MTDPTPAVDPSRCAWQAELRGDPMTGTAPPASRLLLVEQPGPWGPRGLLDSHAGTELARRIDTSAAAAGMRLQAIRRPGRHVDEDGRHRVAVVDLRSGVRTTQWWTVPDLEVLARQLEGAAPADSTWIPSDATTDRAPLLLVCTHGRHDACCALRGRPLVAEIDRLRPGRVWETTHVGGDRFAANLLVVPTGELYGRVAPPDVPRLLARVDAGQVEPSLLRGWFGMAPVAQAALAHAHQEIGAGTHPLEVRDVHRLEDGRSRVVVRTPDGEVVVEVVEEWSDAARLTCRGPATARARRYVSRVVPDERSGSPSRV